MTTKTFDAVAMMRKLRSQLSQEMEHMPPGERIRFVRDKAASSALGKKLETAQGDAARQDRRTRATASPP